MDQRATPPPLSPQPPCPPQSASRSSTQHSSPPPEASKQQCSLLGDRESLVNCPSLLGSSEECDSELQGLRKGRQAGETIA